MHNVSWEQRGLNSYYQFKNDYTRHFEAYLTPKKCQGLSFLTWACGIQMIIGLKLYIFIA